MHYATNRQDQVFNILQVILYRIDYFVIQLLSEPDKQKLMLPACSKDNYH